MSELKWTKEGAWCDYRAQGLRRVYHIKAEPREQNKFRAGIQRGAVTFWCDCPFHYLEDAKQILQSDHNSIVEIAQESLNELADERDEAINQRDEFQKRFFNLQSDLEKEKSHRKILEALIEKMNHENNRPSSTRLS